MTALNARLVIFDWDGTLMDSTGHIVVSVQQAALEMGWEAPAPDKVRAVIGLSLDRALATVMPEPSESAARAFEDAYRRHYLNPDMNEGELFPGVRELLLELREADIWAAVATGKARPGLDRVMKKLDVDHLFVASRCADEARSKPHPQMLEDILHVTGLEAHQAVMVGDTSFDLDMARALRMPAFGVTGGAHPAEQLRACEPMGMLECVTDIRHPLGLGAPQDP